MSRLRQRPQDAPVTLLPFLAVLICTMGALIVLLVVVVQQARVQATEVVDIVDSPTPAADVQIESPPNNEPKAGDELVDAPQLMPAGPTPTEVSRAQQERDKYLWEIKMLVESRDKTRQRLSDKRLELSHLEDHTRRLTAQLNQVEQAAQQTVPTGEPVEAIRAELAQIEQQIAAKEEQLDSAQELAASRRGTYQLVPYAGARGTTRRPIYIECLPDAVIIQPEGVRLDADDFKLTRSAGNPLAAALRAVREYWLTAAGDTQQGDPYPLLVVRPGGETAYAACRQALRSWDDEFGYELIPGEVTLSYPPTDALLKEEIEQAVQLSRQQQQKMKGFLAIHEPDGPVYRASRRNGGFVREGGTSRAASKPSFSRSNTAKSPNQIGVATPAPQALGGSSSEGPALGSPGDGSPIGEIRADDDRAGRFRPTPSAVSSASPPTLSPSASSQDAGFQSGNAAPDCLAGTRGKDWALPNAARGAIPLRRPLYVTVNRAQLVLEAQRGTNETSQAVAFRDNTVDAVQSLVTLIWQRIEGWGVAGPGLYWKPTIEVSVTSDGESRFHELASLLQDSGLELQRR